MPTTDRTPAHDTTAAGVGRIPVLRPADVQAAIEAMRPALATDGWELELIAVRGHFLVVRLDHGRCQGVVPWVLRRLEHELASRVPGLRGVILA